MKKIKIEITFDVVIFFISNLVKTYLIPLWSNLESCIAKASKRGKIFHHEKVKNSCILHVLWEKMCRVFARVGFRASALCISAELRKNGACVQYVDYAQIWPKIGLEFPKMEKYTCAVLPQLCWNGSLFLSRSDIFWLLSDLPDFSLFGFAQALAPSTVRASDLTEDRNFC